MTKTAITTAVWPALAYHDARAAIHFLTDALGFEETAVYPSGADGSVIDHAELRWPPGGGVMLGTANRPEGSELKQPTGGSSVYLVTDEPDALFERATAAGAEVVRGLRDEDYGSRGFTVRDAEGNLWSLGTYRGGG